MFHVAMNYSTQPKIRQYMQLRLGLIAGDGGSGATSAAVRCTCALPKGGMQAAGHEVTGMQTLKRKARSHVSLHVSVGCVHGSCESLSSGRRAA